MNNIEPIIVTLLISLLTLRVLMSAYSATGTVRKRMRIVDIPIVLLLGIFSVIVVRTVMSAAGG